MSAPQPTAPHPAGEVRWAALQDGQVRAREIWTPHLGGAEAWDQRQPEQAEADAVMRSAELAHYCALRALRTAQRQEALPLVVEPARRRAGSSLSGSGDTRFHPGGHRGRGWLWTSEVAKVDWEAARFIAYAVHTTFTAGKVSRLDLERLAFFEALLELLTRSGILYLGYQGGVRRWERGAGRPIDGTGNTWSAARRQLGGVGRRAAVGAPTPAPPRLILDVPKSFGCGTSPGAACRPAQRGEL